MDPRLRGDAGIREEDGGDKGTKFYYSPPMTIDFKYRLKRFFLFSALGLALGAGIAGVSILAGVHGKDGSSVVATGIGGSFTLVNQYGKTVTDKDFAGKHMLVYFGFTSCPAICPTELQKMAVAYKALPPNLQKRVQPIFITVDPEKDTATALKGYVDLFMPELMGLTGTPEQIEAVKKAYKVYASKVGEGDDYTMDHSSFIYFQGIDGQLLAMFKSADKADFITNRIMELQGLD